MAVSDILPAWLNDELPELEPAHRVVLSEEAEVALVAPDGTMQHFSDLASLHDASRSVDFIIDDEVYDHFDADRDLGLFYAVSDSLSGWLMSNTDADRVRHLEMDLQHSLEMAESYEADPANFVKAYRFIDCHPAFWTRSHAPWYWETSNHCNHVQQMVLMDPNDTAPTIALETGQHVPHDGHNEAYTTHYHDYRLDVYAATFEDAYIQLAELVNKFFYPDGTERPDVEHDKPQWIQTVEARVADFEASQAAEAAEAQE